MRRLAALLLSLVLLLTCCASGETRSAVEIAAEMAERIGGVCDIGSASALDGALERARWRDEETDADCWILCYESAETALKTAIFNAGASNLVRSVGECNLYLGNQPDTERADAYEAALREILGVGERETVDYILNVNTRKFHYPSCSSVKTMRESNKFAYVGAREAVVEQGYKACKRCRP